MPDPQVKGLPEGVEFTGSFLPASADDFELIREGPDAYIYKGIRAGAASGVTVRPAAGYVFVQTGFEQYFDIKAYKQVNARPMFVATKSLPPKTMTLTVKFSITNELQATQMETSLKAIPEMPGYISHEVAKETIPPVESPKS